MSAQGGQEIRKIEPAKKAEIIGEWFPIDTLNGQLYLNSYLPYTLIDSSSIYLSSPNDSPNKCVIEEYNPIDRIYDLCFVGYSYEKMPRYVFELEEIEPKLMRWSYCWVNDKGGKGAKTARTFMAAQQGYQADFATYNHLLPEDIQGKTWIWVNGSTYRGDYYYNEYAPVTMRTDKDTIAVLDEYNYSLIPHFIKHYTTDNDTLSIYTIGQQYPEYELIWKDKAKGIIEFHFPWEDTNNTDTKILIDSAKYSPDLYPPLGELYRQDKERVAFFEKWEKKGYTQSQIEHFRWDRYSSYKEGECVETDGETLDCIQYDFDGNGLKDNISLIKDWLYEEENHCFQTYTLTVEKKLDHNVYDTEKGIEIERPRVEDLSININPRGELELHYGVYANRDYDLWEYKYKTLADVDSVNNYTYTYKYNKKTKDWDLKKIDAIIKTPSDTIHRSKKVSGRTLYTLDPEMNPLDDIEGK